MASLNTGSERPRPHHSQQTGRVVVAVPPSDRLHVAALASVALAVAPGLLLVVLVVR